MTGDAGSHSAYRPARPRTVCFPFAGDLIGGSHLSALRLIEMLPAQRYRPLVVLHNPSGPVAEHMGRRGIPFAAAPAVDLPGGRGMSLPAVGKRLTATTLTLRRFLKDQRVDIVHTNEGAMHVSWGIAAKAAGAKLLWHHRADPNARGVTRLAPWIADHIVTVSRFAAPKRAWPSIEGRCTVVRSPFDPRAVEDRARARRMVLDALDVSDDTKVLVFAGVFEARKRPLVFVEIIKVLAERHPDIRVVGAMFGEASPAAPQIEVAVRQRVHGLGLADRIRFMGFRFPFEPWLTGSDLLVVPAVDEPFGRTLIEAMMLGVPVVAAASGGNLEAIEDGRNGFLVAADEVTAFLPPLWRLLSDPALHERIAEQARSDALASFSSEAHLSQILATYDRLLGTA